MRILSVVALLAMLVCTASYAEEQKAPAEQPKAPAEQPKEQPKEEPKKEEPVAKNTIVVMSTSKGDIKIKLWDDKAPITVKNFLQYVDAGFYNNTIFHRVIPGFMIQGGGFDEKMKQKETKEPIKNEATPDKQNKRGTLAMARTNVVDSATSQFFINLVDNKMLDNGVRDFGYCAFGEVIEGMDIVDEIAKVKTGRVPPHSDVPVEPVIIKSVKRVEK